MGVKSARLDIIKLIISSQEVGSQDELQQELIREGFHVTQATLSRDLKQLKVAKANSMSGKSVYVLPNNTMYKRVREHQPVSEMKLQNGVVSIVFSGNLGVIRTRPGYAGSVAYDIDNAKMPEVIGTVAGDDTIILVLEENSSREVVKMRLDTILNG
ncbi:MAG: arginine repressor [Bacteroidaceae bacterium]|nr:arginine repressor [Bacteroidaceae bacterium]